MTTVSTRLSDDEEVWCALVEGRPVDYQRGVAYCGVWKSRNREGIEYPVRTFRDPLDGTVSAWSGLTGEIVLCDEYWLEERFGFLLKRPCSAEDYEHWLAEGRFPPEPTKPKKERKRKA